MKSKFWLWLGIILVIGLLIWDIPTTFILFGEKKDLEQRLKDKKP